MTDRKSEWLKHYSLLITDEAKWQLFVFLKASRDKADQEALRILVEKWLGEK